MTVKIKSWSYLVCTWFALNFWTGRPRQNGRSLSTIPGSIAGDYGTLDPHLARMYSLTLRLTYAKHISVMRVYSTKQVAELVGVHWVTLHHWLKAKKVSCSMAFPMNGRTFRGWTDEDIALLRKYKEGNYRKGRGRKKKAKH